MKLDMPSTRRANLAALQAELSPGDLAQFAALVGKSSSAVSDLLHGRKSFGEKMARSIEEHAGLPAMYLDQSSGRDLLPTTVGQRARARRQELGLTQIEVAELSGMKQSTISDLERGRNESTIELVALSSALKCSPEWLKLGVPSQTDGERLRTLFDELKETDGMSRAAFAVKHKIPGGDAMIYQHIVGLKPISMDAGMAYAKGFGCSLADSSPRLAGEASKVAAANQFLSPEQNDALNLISSMTDAQAKLWLSIGRTILDQ